MLFRSLEIHSLISALCFFNVSNKHTFGLIFKTQETDGKASILQREQVIDAILRFVSR